MNSTGPTAHCAWQAAWPWWAIGLAQPDGQNRLCQPTWAWAGSLNDETGEARVGTAGGAGAGHLAHRRWGEAGCGLRRSPVRWCSDLNQRRGGGAYQQPRSTAAHVEQRRLTAADRTRGAEHRWVGRRGAPGVEVATEVLVVQMGRQRGPSPVERTTPGADWLWAEARCWPVPVTWSSMGTTGSSTDERKRHMGPVSHPVLRPKPDAHRVYA
jgi:hypothetical protein